MNSRRLTISSAKPNQPGVERSLAQISPALPRAIHDLALATIAEDLTPGALHDFTHHVAPALAGLEHLADQTEGRLPTGLESYVMTRLGGYRRSTYLDSLDLFVAIKTCELIGAVEVFGRTANLNRLTDEEWRVAGAAGFAIADGGAASVRDFL